MESNGSVHFGNWSHCVLENCIGAISSKERKNKKNRGEYGKSGANFSSILRKSKL